MKIPPTIRHISVLNIPEILDFNLKLTGWILSLGFTLFLCQKPHFSGLQFDGNCKIAIRCMYQFGICNNFIKFDSLHTLNIPEFLNAKGRPQCVVAVFLFLRAISWILYFCCGKNDLKMWQACFSFVSYKYWSIPFTDYMLVGPGLFFSLLFLKFEPPCTATGAPSRWIFAFVNKPAYWTNKFFHFSLLFLGY